MKRMFKHLGEKDPKFSDSSKSLNQESITITGTFQQQIDSSKNDVISQFAGK